MPFYTQDDLMAGGETERQAVEIDSTAGTSLGQAFEAGIRNIPLLKAPADFVDSAIGRSGKIDKDFESLSEQNLKGYEGFAGSFVDVFNAEDSDYVKRKIDRELRDNDLLSSSPNGVMGGLGSGLLDPINMIPIIGQAGKVYQLGKLGRVASTASRMAVTGAVSGTVNEIIDQSTSDTKTLEESAINIGQTAVFSGVLGSAFSAFSKGRLPVDTALQFSKAENEAETFANAVADIQGGSVGAAAVFKPSLQQEALKDAFGLEKGLSFQDPLLRTANSPSVDVRAIAQELAEQPLLREKNAEGIASPIASETLMRNWQAGLYKANEAIEDSFVKYRMGRGKKFGDLPKIGISDLRGSEKLTLEQFSEEVGKAMRRGDTHEIPEVAAAAKAMRENVFDPLKDEAISLGLLPEGVKPETADSYLTRVYDVSKIIAQRPDFEGRITEWLKGKQSITDAELQKLTTERKINADTLDKTSPEYVASAFDLRAQDDALSETTAAFEKSDQKLKATDQDYRQSFKDVQAAEARVAETKAQLDKAKERFSNRIMPIRELKRLPDKLLTDKHPDVAQRVKEINAPLARKPQSLVQFLKSKGGLLDQGGELTNMDARKAVRGLIKNDGLPLDQARKMAVEEGFLREDSGMYRPNESTEQEIKGQPVYRQKDLESADIRSSTMQDSELFNDYLGEFDINAKGRSSADVIRDMVSKGLLSHPLEENFNTYKIRGKTLEAEKTLNALRKEADARAESLKKIQEEYDFNNKNLADLKAKVEGLKTRTAEQDKTIKTATKRNARLDNEIEFRKGLSQLGDGDLQDIAAQVTDKIIGMSRGSLPYSPIQLVRGPLKERTLAITDAAIEDFLESDVRKVSRIYSRSMAADVELTRKFGNVDMTDQIEKIKDGYAQLRAKTKNEKELIKLDKQERADIRDISAMRDRLRGNYALPSEPDGIAVRTSRVVKNLNYMRLLGGMTMSAIPDLGRNIMVHGFERTFKDGIMPMVKNFEKFRFAAEEVKLAGNALDMVLDERTMGLADIMDDFSRTSKFERGVDALSTKFGLVSLMAPWNAALKQFSGVVTQTRILQAAEDIGGMSPKERQRAAFLGLDKPMLSRIAKQFKEFGNKEDGIYWANTGAWTDREAITAYRSALSKEVNLVIVTPGQDKPLFMSKPLVGLIGQFKSFALSANQRVLLSGLQNRDAAAMSGTLLSIGLGMMVYRLRTPDERISDDWRQWVAEGVDRAGVTGTFFDVNNMLEKATSGNIGVARLTGKQMSRYQSRNITGALLGPSSGLLEDGVRVVGSAASGEWKGADTHAMRQMLPFQNLFYVRSLFDAVENGFNESMGIEAKPVR